jgi:hypothetical protein
METRSFAPAPLRSTVGWSLGYFGNGRLLRAALVGLGTGLGVCCEPEVSVLVLKADFTMLGAMLVEGREARGCVADCSLSGEVRLELLNWWTGGWHIDARASRCGNSLEPLSWACRGHCAVA